MIRFEGVHKWFGRLHVLNDINLQVRSGEVVVVCGPSGSGKSTLIRTINDLEPINEGRLVVDGMDLSDRKTDINKLRAEIGFVFQQFNLYPHLSVLKNITLAPIKIRNTPEKEAAEQAMAILERVGLPEKRDAYPSQLSGGQQQRVAIARALVNKPEVILADEPTGNLDLRTGEEIIQLLGRMQKEMKITVISATHDMKMLSTSDFVVWISDGRIARQARRDEIKIEVGTINGHTLA